MPGFSTRAIRVASRVPKAPQPPINVPIYQTSTFEVSSAEELAELLDFSRPGHSYSRYSNPTHAALEDALAELEGAEACHITASGMAAIHAAMLSVLSTGDEVIIPRAVYGGVVGLAQVVLAKSGIGVNAVDTTDADAVEAAIGERTRLLWVETISNPTTAMSDIARLAELAHGRGIVLAVDNTFASPYLANPLALGADLVVHSTTKYIGGHSDITGGAVLGSAERVAAARQIVINVGGNAAPLEAFLALRGLKTLGHPDGSPFGQRPGSGLRPGGRAGRGGRPLSGPVLASAARAGRAHAARRDGRRDAEHRPLRAGGRPASASWTGSPSRCTPPAWVASRRSAATRPPPRTGS